MSDATHVKEVLALSLVKNVGPILARQLLAYFKTPSAIFQATERELMAVPNIGATVAKSIRETRALEEAERELPILEKEGITPLTFDSPHYPPLLKDIPSAPLILFYRGRVETIAHTGKRTLSIVGTRKATSYGKGFVQNFIAELKDYDPSITIVSGLAYGIDAEAHTAALEQGLPTVGVLGHGFSYLYPPKHHLLAKQMLDNGGLLTEYPYHREPDAPNFLQRNRLIAGIASATIVVESAAHGGALSTANYCLEYKRHLFAVPGYVGKTWSVGCNRLIAQHKASLIEGVEDLIAALKWEKRTGAAPSGLFFFPSPEEQQLLDAIGNGEPKSFDEIVQEIDFPINQLQTLLFDLEMKGQIRQLPGRMYEKTH